MSAETPTSETVTVTRDDEASRYDIRVGDAVAGFAAFVLDDGRVVMTHTQIDPAWGGRGLGSTLVKEALTDLAARGIAVVPQCPFVAAYLQDHEVPGLVIEWPDENEDGAVDEPTS
ncbi:GNAT family N-acetyltransferase [Microbacterium sp. P04]|uniref:GNAT family N-acetyltransferase n=1 Tax=Microbacterium sp. P04 TaxID=3366947 RepID=UPI003744BE5F